MPSDWTIYIESTEIETTMRAEARKWLDLADGHMAERQMALARLQSAGVPLAALAETTGLHQSRVQRMVEAGRRLLAESVAVRDDRASEITVDLSDHVPGVVTLEQSNA